MDGTGESFLRLLLVGTLLSKGVIEDEKGDNMSVFIKNGLCKVDNTTGDAVN